MKKIINLTLVLILLSGCVSNSPPACYNKVKIVNRIYEVAIFKKENDKYLAGYPFHGWTKKTDYVDTSECDKLNP